MDKEGRGQLFRTLLPFHISHCHNIEWQVMNEVALHRGASPHLNTIDAFVDGQHLTESVVRYNALFSLSKILYTDIIRRASRTVGRSHRLDAHRIYRLLIICRWSHRTSLTKRARSHSYMSPKSVLQTTRIPFILFNYSTSMSLAFQPRPRLTDLTIHR